MSEVVGEAVVIVRQDDSGIDLGRSGERAGKGFTDGFKGIFTKLPALAGVAAVGAVVGATFLGALNLDAANAKMQAQLGLTGAEAEKAGQLAGSLYADNFGDSIGGVQSSIGVVISGIKGMRNASESDLKAASTAALSYASIFDADLPEAVNSANLLINSGLASSTTQAFDLMTASAQQVPEALRGDLTDAVNEYSKHFASIGLSGEQSFGLLLAGADQGTIGIDKAGDAIKEFGIRATDLGDTGAQDALKSLGLSGQEMANDLLAGGERAAGATDKIAKGLLGIDDPAKQAVATTALFGTQIEDIGKEKIGDFLTGLTDSSTAMGDVTGATDRAAQVLNDTPLAKAAGLWRQVSGAVQGFALDALGPVVDGLTVVGDKVGEFVPIIADGLQPVFEEVSAFVTDTVAPALGELSTYVADLLPSFEDVIGFVQSDVLPILETLGSFIIDTIVPSFIEIATVVAENLKPVFDQLVVTFQTQIMPAFSALSDQVQNQLLPAIMPVIEHLISFAKVTYTVASAILGFLLPPLIKITAFVVTSLIPILVGIIVVVFRVVGAIFSFVKAIVAVVVAIGQFYGAVIRLVSGALSSLVSAVASIPGKLIALGSKFVGAGKSLIGSFLDGLGKVGGFASDLANSVWNAVKSAINSGIDKLNGLLDFSIKVGPKTFHVSAPDIGHLQSGNMDGVGAGFYRVGEVGPETVYLPEGARVATAAQTRQASDSTDVNALAQAFAVALAPLLAGMRPITVSVPGSDPEAVAMQLMNRLVTA